ncbi:fungal-specific transcription factor domain-containing protein [Lasiosphaeria ovina]|uniref:Fungal-specific transcription factor domain-containing protein n=1 Tax=Lasiosphaeria ovina TaxID=92902 RepID=A0AAE0KGG7_9PEZI|nr:fungal-specific transcription factor domain-containing protein [Lasiosphaeria ovina]
MNDNPPSFRRLLPAMMEVDNTGSESDSQAKAQYQYQSQVDPESASGPSRKRGAVTRVACTPCRVRKSGCDGQRPACSLCLKRNVECAYSAADSATLREENEALSKVASDNMELVWLMSTAPEPVAWEMLLALRARPNAGFVPRNSVGGGEISKLPVPNDVSSESWHAPSLIEMQPPEGSHSASPNTSNMAALNLSDAIMDREDSRAAGHVWTGVTSDSGLVLHLLGLYFCWEYPIFATLSKEHFMKDFEAGLPRYCSPILVNALLALGCCFSTRPSTRTDPNDGFTSGNHFFSESLRLFDLQTDHTCLTTIQALGIMAIREANCGRRSESSYYASQSMRLAVEMGLHRPSGALDQDRMDVEATTFWGAYSLDHAWTLVSVSLPQTSFRIPRPPKPPIIDALESLLWIPITDDGLYTKYSQPSNTRTVFRCLCEISDLVHQSVFMLRTPGRPLTRDALLEIYTNYLDWYDGIPNSMRLGLSSTPAVLFVHLYYHFTIITLFRPLIKTRIPNSTLSPQDVSCQAADAIRALLRSYSQLYTLKRVSSFMPYFVLAASIMRFTVWIGGQSDGDNADHAATVPHLGPGVADDIIQGIADLEEMESSRFALHGLHLLRDLAKRWNIDVSPPNIGPPNIGTPASALSPPLLPHNAYQQPSRASTNNSDVPVQPNDFQLEFMRMWDQIPSGLAAEGPGVPAWIKGRAGRSVFGFM